ncbi:MAG: AMP-binding protein, partial [Gaiellaceae bacterium]
MTNTIETMLLEERRYTPDPEFARQANAQPDIYERDWEEFWETEGRNRVTWFEPFSKLYEWEPPYAKWYLGGTLNVCFNCVDRHVDAGNGDRVAYFWEGEPEDERRTITFADLQREVVRFANGLKGLGVKKGTPVAIYMGMVPELPIAMLTPRVHGSGLFTRGQTQIMSLLTLGTAKEGQRIDDLSLETDR